jgi:metal-responsive CopG/Arc/MetJ family transcriptional regulator
MRTLIDIPDDDLVELDALAQHNNRSRAAEVREAIRLHLRNRSGKNWIAQGAGYWRDRADIGDTVDYQRQLREDREFD